VDNSCEICGSRGAGNVCEGCGRTVCARCYSESHGLCVDCVSRMTDAYGKRGMSSTLRILGIIFIVVGLSVVSLSFSTESEENGTVVIFPFILGNADGLFAAVFTVMFFAIFLLASLLPLYLSRKGPRGERTFGARREKESTHVNAENVEYVITTELPREIVDNIHVEAGDGEILLLSSVDEGFRRRYSIPGGFDVERLDYDYEDNYLIVRLTLKRTK